MGELKIYKCRKTPANKQIDETKSQRNYKSNKTAKEEDLDNFGKG